MEIQYFEIWGCFVASYPFNSMNNALLNRSVGGLQPYLFFFIVSLKGNFPRSFFVVALTVHHVDAFIRKSANAPLKSIVALVAHERTAWVASLRPCNSASTVVVDGSRRMLPYASVSHSASPFASVPTQPWRFHPQAADRLPRLPPSKWAHSFVIVTCLPGLIQTVEACLSIAKLHSRSAALLRSR